VAELMQQAEARQAHPLRSAITEVVTGAVDPAKKLGQALRKAQGVALDGLRVLRIGSDSKGCVWQVTC